MENFEVLSLKDSIKWKSFISKLPLNKRDIYITPEYYSLYEKKDNATAECIVYEKNNFICIFPYLINPIKTKRLNKNNKYYDLESAYGYSGIIFNNTNNEFIDNFFLKLRNYLEEKNIIICFLRFNPFQKISKKIFDNILIKKDRRTIYLDLNKNYQNIFNEMYSSNNRNMIRKSQNNFYSKISNSMDQIDLFVKNYYETLSRLKADEFYYFDKYYFNKFTNNLKNNSIIVNIFDKNNQCHASSLILTYGNYAHYHLSAKSNISNDNSVTNYMIDEVIKYLINNNYKFFHLGGGRSNDKNDSLLKFKKNFSKTFFDFYYGKILINEKIYNQVNDQWDKENPNKTTKYKNYILKYRY